MNSSRPYIIRALYEWILDNDCTPHILVHANAEGVEVPQQHVQKGQIVLNVDPTAVVDLLMDNEAISFNARFSGLPTDIYIPMHAIIGIVTKENGQGMMFDFSEPPSPDDSPDSDKLKQVTTAPSDIRSKSKSQAKPTLKIVK